MNAPPPKHGHWSRIGAIPNSGVVQRNLDAPDGGFGPIRGLFRPTGRRARHIWCDHCCSPYEVVPAPDGLVAVTRVEDGLCPDIPIESNESLEIWELDYQALGLLVQEALGLRPADPAEREMGMMGRDVKYDRPLVFVGARSEARRISEMQRLRGEYQGGFAVLLPVRSHYGPNLRVLAETLRVGVLVGEDVLEWVDGRFQLMVGFEDKVLRAFSSITQVTMSDLKDHLDNRFDTLGHEYAALKEENERLKGDLASTISHLAKTVDAQFFYWVLTVLAKGSVLAASKALGIPNSSFSGDLKKWAARGGTYQKLYGMIECRQKGVGKRSIESFNDEWIGHQGGADVSDPGLLREMLDVLEDMNEANWESMRNEFIELLKEEVL